MIRGANEIIVTCELFLFFFLKLPSFSRLFIFYVKLQSANWFTVHAGKTNLAICYAKCGIGEEKIRQLKVASDAHEH